MLHRICRFVLLRLYRIDNFRFHQCIQLRLLLLLHCVHYLLLIQVLLHLYLLYLQNIVLLFLVFQLRQELHFHFRLSRLIQLLRFVLRFLRHLLLDHLQVFHYHHHLYLNLHIRYLKLICSLLNHLVCQYRFYLIRMLVLGLYHFHMSSYMLLFFLLLFYLVQHFLVLSYSL